MQKHSRWEIEEYALTPRSAQRSAPRPAARAAAMPAAKQYATVVPLNLGHGISLGEKMHKVNEKSGEFLRSEARYKSNVKMARDKSKPYVDESRSIIRHIFNLEKNNKIIIEKLKKMTAPYKKPLRDMYELELLQNNELIMRYKDQLNEMKRIQELIYRTHEVPLHKSKTIKDAKVIHNSKPYVQFLGTKGGRSRKTKIKTRKIKK
jgi:hypothetical protein